MSYMPSHGGEKMKRYLKLFLATGIPVGALIGGFYSLLYGFPKGLITGLFAGIFFGSSMSLIHRWSVKQMFSGKSKEAMNVCHVRNIDLQVSYDKAFDLCIGALNLIKRCKIRNEDRSQGKIDAKVGMTWKTWGDVISFDVRKIDNDRTQIEVSSRPAVRTTLIDCGKNLENVKKIIRFLKEHSEMAYNK
jgi:hypothetical protein